MKESIDVVLACRLIKYCIRNARALCVVVPSVCQCLVYGGELILIAVFVNGKERVIILLHKSSSIGNLKSILSIYEYIKKSAPEN